jgi:hypothetical protein
MTRATNDLDEFGKRTLAPLQPTPPMDSQAAMEARSKFLLEGENLRQALILQSGSEEIHKLNEKHNLVWLLQHKPLMKALVAIVLAFVIILVGSTATVFASQNSLPGQVLYPVKSWSEDIRLSMTTSADTKLNLTLIFTNRRMEEISTLLADGKGVSDQTAERFANELENALQLAAQLDDTQIQHALVEIKSHAEHQGMTMQELIVKLPPQAEPAVVKLQQRLNEQVQLSNIGEIDPKEFRLQVHARFQKQHGPKHSTESESTLSTPDTSSVTPVPRQDGNNQGEDMSEPTKVPGHDDQGNGQGQSTPGNGNHGQNPTHTPKP